MVNPLLRNRGVEFRHSDQSGIQPCLLDALSGTSAEFGRPLGITSGYRSPQRNAEVVGAKQSYHMQGRAADIDMSGMSPADRQKLVRELTQRGVGGFITYSGSPDMLHVDTRPRAAGESPRFMHDKSAANMGRAPDWMKEAAQSGGLTLPQQAPIPPANPGSLIAYEPSGASRAAPGSGIAPGSASTWLTNPLTSAAMSAAEYMGFGGTPAQSLPPDRPMPAGPVPGGLVSLPPARPMPSGPVAYNSLPPDRPMPGGMLAQPQLPALPPPRTVLDLPVYQAPPAPVQQFPAAPQMPQQPSDPFGNSASINGSGNRVVTNKYGVSTAMLDDGRTAAIRGPLGMREGITPMSAPTSLGDRLPGMAKTMAGGMAGGAVGGLLGPVGSVIGAIIGRDLANGRNPLDRLNPQLRQFPNAPMQQNQFPSAPKNKSGALSGRESNLSQSEMQSISPKAASDIAAGRGGLF